ncbi:MAG: AAA family ATPase [Burkholderiaceae bacterium]
MRDTPHPATIKTTAPSLQGVVERPRLLNALSQLPAASKWLQAPSGTGKSTLAASYARSVGKPFAWYQLDERDNDPAFFFENFSDAAEAQLDLAAPLPKFLSDDHSRPQKFARRHFGALPVRLQRPVLIILDDAQHVTAEPSPAGLRLIRRLGSSVQQVSHRSFGVHLFGSG